MYFVSFYMEIDFLLNYLGRRTPPVPTENILPMQSGENCAIEKQVLVKRLGIIIFLFSDKNILLQFRIFVN